MTFLQALEKSSTVELYTYIILLLTSVLLYIFSDYFKKCILALRLPGPKAYPIIGSCLEITKTGLVSQEMANAYKKYGPLARFWLSAYPMFVVFDPDDLKVILSSKKHTDKSVFYKLLHNFLGRGLITSSGHKWSSHRKLIQPSFSIAILEKFTETFSDSASALIDKLPKEETVLNVTEYVNNCVLDILNEAVLGVPVKSTDKKEMETSPFRQGKVVAPYRLTHPWLLFNFIYKLTDAATVELDQKKQLEEFSRKMIDRRREALKTQKPTDRRCLMDFMIEISNENPDFTEDDIIDEACTFMLAGQDSVGAALAFTLFLLARHQDHQAKCYEEIRQHIGSDPSMLPTAENIRELRHLEACIKESLRLYPSVPLMARKIGEDVRVGKYQLPAGSEVLILPYATHRVEHVYPDPERFNPERFGDGAPHQNPYAFLPFSAGPRNCIGYKFAYIEMKTIVSRVLQNFHLSPAPGKEEVLPIFRMTLRAKGGLWVKLTPRKVVS
ncbi:probable cytochrome P450 4aa1 [Anopheles ziemanni]|uniref:probable cytochrome P450 4aa1 n=1 Tax=Anopheles coustani TaxID=139045 RepID=UPI0026593CB4|nr:probable cytochrome P450 4aa1 [Anopheles coustani]XP_058171928.1 probable cytochrome P450 4aa1 [Anopheles ziemanni]